MDEVRFETGPAPFEQVQRLAGELGLGSLAAQTLVRRGLADPDGAQSFLNADEAHPPEAFGGIDEACGLIERHLANGAEILVHGDYDADGACSTAILVAALRELGGRVAWFIPGRREDGYGLSMETVERAARRGVGLLITADCGIASVDEVDAARSLGVDVVVTDHHRPRADGSLPDAPIVHPVVSQYPFPDLCAAAVAQKLAARLRQRAGVPEPQDSELDLVAIATIADCVALVGENRRLVVEGLLALRQTRRPGLRALMRVSGTDPGAVDEQTVAFRLAPRINAAGRVQRADAAVELLLASDAEDADRCALELDQLNAERRHIETRIRFEAESQIAAAGPQPGYVLSSADWHPGVIGITASRLAERHGRPVVLVALDGGTGTGSGRSVAGFDLLAALDACAPTMLRHGGHAAAAGCTVEEGRVVELREAFVEYCRRELGEGPSLRKVEIDAVAAPGAMTLDAAADLARLGPFGAGNPTPTILLPCVRLVDARAMGEGRHLRCTVDGGGRRAAAVAFGSGSLPAIARDVVDLSCRLEVNRWRGREEPRVLIDGIAAARNAAAGLIGEPDDEAAALVEAVRDLFRESPQTPLTQGRQLVDHGGEDPASVIAALAAGGQSTAVVTRDAHRLRRRFHGLALGAGLVSWQAWRSDPSLLDGYEHVVAVDPPLSGADRALLEHGLPGQSSHLAWGEAELRSTLDELRREQDLRAAMVAVYRAASERPQADAADLLGAGDPDRSREQRAVIAGVFEELGIAQLDADGQLVMRSGAASKLASSEVGRRHRELLEERLQWLSAPASLAA